MLTEKLKTNDEHSNHEIPFSRNTIIEMVLNDGTITQDEITLYKGFSQMLMSIFHFEFHKQLEELKDFYAPFNPDVPDNAPINNDDNNEYNVFSKDITSVIIDANYNALSDEDINKALEAESLFPVSAEVDFSKFEECKLFYQGQSRSKAKIATVIPFYEKEIEVEFFDRIILMIKVKDCIDQKKTKSSTSHLEPGKIYLKYFRNIPKLDLEMIFPDIKPKMKLIHKLQIWVTLFSGVAIALKEFVYAPFIAMSSPSPFDGGISVGVLAVLIALFGYASTTYEKYQKITITLMSAISQSLYFKDVGNNEAVLTSLVDSAEEEEVKEALLAYYFLWKSSTPLQAIEIDQAIENWMLKKHNTEIDFEITDGLAKLDKLGILILTDDKYTVPSLGETMKKLDQTWDNYFVYT